MSTRWSRLAESFRRDRAIYWSNLARTSNLLVVLNVSFFFLTELVTREGYYYTYYSLGFLGLIYLAMLLPLGWTDRLGFYCLCLASLGVALYFVAVSVWYWVTHSQMSMRMG